MRNTLSEKNMLKNFLKEHAYSLSQISSRGSNVTIHPLRNIMDESTFSSGWGPCFPVCLPPAGTPTPTPHLAAPDEPQS